MTPLGKHLELLSRTTSWVAAALEEPVPQAVSPTRVVLSWRMRGEAKEEPEEQQVVLLEAAVVQKALLTPERLGTVPLLVCRGAIGQARRLISSRVVQEGVLAEGTVLAIQAVAVAVVVRRCSRQSH
jgi:hypothetical protein